MTNVRKVSRKNPNIIHSLLVSALLPCAHAVLFSTEFCGRPSVQRICRHRYHGLSSTTPSHKVCSLPKRFHPHAEINSAWDDAGNDNSLSIMYLSTPICVHICRFNGARRWLPLCGLNPPGPAGIRRVRPKQPYNALQACLTAIAGATAAHLGTQRNAPRLLPAQTAPSFS